ncbi:hypothetical protein PPL_08494 [Heterostelium album PN500]|uniref:EGF-like domain-containing protein n=1 Tax=Heterostelium pallidum (strain ATCC 26659 / Pp 5 / PN500) TaxID=670386 RepID=D3BIC5_HETP5|nr:hypothetical protein PPL_08494 [Heterostelium album PN500]EFA79025.1 hypothetical protein PPL_08494 [Heterostelium album PN500]|eukprot:XP_020431148.1 hypothetical protein PPL_08494 [Heterostelium album PN500]
MKIYILQKFIFILIFIGVVFSVPSTLIYTISQDEYNIGNPFSPRDLIIVVTDISPQRIALNGLNLTDFQGTSYLTSQTSCTPISISAPCTYNIPLDSYKSMVPPFTLRGMNGVDIVPIEINFFNGYNLINNQVVDFAQYPQRIRPYGINICQDKEILTKYSPDPYGYLLGTSNSRATLFQGTSGSGRYLNTYINMVGSSYQLNSSSSLLFGNAVMKGQVISCIDPAPFDFNNQTMVSVNYMALPNQPYTLLDVNAPSSNIIGFTSISGFNTYINFYRGIAGSSYRSLLIQTASQLPIYIHIDSSSHAYTMPTTPDVSITFTTPVFTTTSDPTTTIYPHSVFAELSETVAVKCSFSFLNGSERLVSEIRFYDESILNLLYIGKDDFKKSPNFEGILNIPIGYSLGPYYFTIDIVTYSGSTRQLSGSVNLYPKFSVVQGEVNHGYDLLHKNLLSNYTSIPFVWSPAKLDIYQLLLNQTIQSRYSFSFPYGFYGNKIQGSSVIPLPMPFDTPRADLQYKVTTYSSSTLSVFTNNLNSTAILTDCLNPIVNVEILEPSKNIDRYRFLVNVTDNKLGIRESFCNILFGPYSYTLNSSNRISGNAVVGQYIVSSDYSAAYRCSTPIVMGCYDIRNNYFVAQTDQMCGDVPCTDFGIVKPSLACDSSMDPIYFTRLSYFSYDYFDAGTITFTIAISGVVQSKFSGNATLYFYEDEANTIPFSYIPNGVALTASQNTQPTSSSNILVSNPVALPLLPRTKTIYFGLKYAISSTGPSFTLKTKDIDYFAKQVSQLYPISKIVIRNSNYQPLPSIKMVATQQNPSITALYTTGNFSLIRNATFVYVDDYIIYPKYLYYFKNDIANIFTIQLGSVSAGNNFILYCQSMCDLYDNCQTFPKYTYFTSITNATAQSKASTYPTIQQFTINTPNQILDVSQLTNQFSYTFTFTTTTDLNPTYQGQSAKLYITENDSYDSIEALLPLPTKSGDTYVYNGFFTLPYSWGLRGVKISAWGFIDTNLNAFGFDSLKPSVIVTISNNTAITSAVIDLQSNSIKVTGSNLYYSIYKFQGVPITPIFENSYTIHLPLTGITYSTDKFHYLEFNNEFYRLTTLSCPMNCSGNGDCLVNQCVCKDGFQGLDCSISSTFTCKDNCTNRGDCIDQLCQCNSGYSGASCEIDNTQTKIDMKLTEVAAQTTLTNFNITTLNSSQVLTEQSRSTTYNISIYAINEKNSDDDVVASLDLKWQLVSSPSENSTLYNLMNAPNSSIISVRIDKYMEGGSTVWANQTMKFPAAAIKYTVNITGYQMQGPLNFLEVVFSTVSYGECSVVQDNKISWGAASLDDMHYFVIPQHQMQCYGRFPNSLIVDGRITSTSNKIIQKSEPVLIASRIPYFQNSAIIDPDFSVLVNYDQENEGDGGCGGGGSSRKPYVIPLIVVGCVIFVTIAVVFAVVLLKKNMYIRERIAAIKSKSIKMSKRTN